MGEGAPPHPTECLETPSMPSPTRGEGKAASVASASPRFRDLLPHQLAVLRLAQPFARLLRQHEPPVAEGREARLLSADALRLGRRIDTRHQRLAVPGVVAAVRHVLAQRLARRQFLPRVAEHRHHPPVGVEDEQPARVLAIGRMHRRPVVAPRRGLREAPHTDDGAHFTTSPSFLICAAHLLSLSLMLAAYCAGVDGIAAPPSSTSRCLMSGMASTLFSSALCRATISFGVLVGATRP